MMTKLSFAQAAELRAQESEAKAREYAVKGRQCLGGAIVSAVALFGGAYFKEALIYAPAAGAFIYTLGMAAVCHDMKHNRLYWAAADRYLAKMYRP